MNIDRDTVLKVADLARIEVKDEEITGLTLEMNKILTFMEKLNELDTSGVEPLVYMNREALNVWREDVVKQEISMAEGLMNAAQHNDSYFMVPKMVDTVKTSGEK